MKQRKTIRIGLVSAMWQRHELTDLVFSHLAYLRARLKGVMELVFAVAGSEGDASRNIAARHGFLYVETENQPLGSKWNAALSLLRDQDVDGVVILGSDDLINERYFHVLADLPDHCLLAGLDVFYILDMDSGRLLEWQGYLPPREGETIGAGRFVRRSLLDAAGWRLWEDRLAFGLDASMMTRLREVAAGRGKKLDVHVLAARKEGIVLVDIKSSTLINTFEKLALSTGGARLWSRPRAFLQAFYPPEPLDRLCPETAGAEAPLQEVELGPSGLSGGKNACRVGFDLRAHAAMFLEAPEKLAEIPPAAQAFINDPAWVKSGEKLFFVAPVNGVLCGPENGLFMCRVCNREIFLHLFRVYLLPFSIENPTAGEDILAAGAPLVCHADLARRMGADERDGVFGVTDWRQAVTVTRCLCEKRSVWERVAGSFVKRPRQTVDAEPRSQGGDRRMLSITKRSHIGKHV